MGGAEAGLESKSVSLGIWNPGSQEPERRPGKMISTDVGFLSVLVSAVSHSNECPNWLV